MSRLSIFNEDDKVERLYKSSLAFLGFRVGATPSSKEIDEAYTQRRNYLSNTTILDQSYANLQQPIYRYERVYERIQHQYLLKQYDILYRYYYLLENEGLTKDSEKLLKSCEDEYEKCLTDIRQIETESNIVAELIASGIDDSILDNFISGLEKRDIDEEFDIDSMMLNTKLNDLKQQINDLYYVQSSKSRIGIKKDYISKVKTLNDFMQRFPSTEQYITNYLNEQTKVIVSDDTDLAVRREHLNDVTFISGFLTHPVNGNPNTTLAQLSNKLDMVKHKFDYLLKLKKINYIKLFKKKIFAIDNDHYLENLANFNTALSKLDDKYRLFDTYTNIIGLIIGRNRISNEDATYVDGILNSFDNYLNKLDTNNELTSNINNTLTQEQTEISSFCEFKNRSIYENIMYRYVGLRKQINAYYDQAFIPDDSRKNIIILLHNYGKSIKDDNISLKDKLAIIDHMASFANNYCSNTDLKQQNAISK